MNHEAQCLGYFAAMCDIFADDPFNTQREREQLLARADRYRDLQEVALADPQVCRDAMVDRLIEAMRGM